MEDDALSADLVRVSRAGNAELELVRLGVAMPSGVSGTEMAAALLGGKTHTPGLSMRADVVHERSGRPLGCFRMRRRRRSVALS